MIGVHEWMTRVLDPADLPPKVKHTLMVVASFLDFRTGTGYASQKAIGARMGLEERAVRDRLAEAFDSGLIVRTRQGAKGRGASTYALTLPLRAGSPEIQFDVGSLPVIGAAPAAETPAPVAITGSAAAGYSPPRAAPNPPEAARQPAVLDLITGSGTAAPLPTHTSQRNLVVPSVTELQTARARDVGPRPVSDLDRLLGPELAGRVLAAELPAAISPASARMGVHRFVWRAVAGRYAGDVEAIRAWAAGLPPPPPPRLGQARPPGRRLARAAAA